MRLESHSVEIINSPCGVREIIYINFVPSIPGHLASSRYAASNDIFYWKTTSTLAFLFPSLPLVQHHYTLNTLITRSVRSDRTTVYRLEGRRCDRLFADCLGHTSHEWNLFSSSSEVSLRLGTLLLSDCSSNALQQSHYCFLRP